MIFNSLHFLIFLPVVIFLYYSLPYKWRWLLLLFASYYFYMCWKAEYAFLIVFSTTVDYYTANKMSRLSDRKSRLPYLMISLISNLGLLFSFKYFNFFNDSARAVFEQFDIFYNVPEFNLFLPVGISFYTFQALSYSIDVYRGDFKAEKNFGYFALFISYWPQLVAGPIERPGDLQPQLKQNFDFDYDRVKQGLIRILYGFFKKVVIADRLGLFVQQVYGNTDGHGGWVDPSYEHGGFAIILATWMFAIQVYCDFGGYCDIAIGSAKIMGHNLTDNFKTPYFSKTIREFWERWHITLTVWVRDYLYIPLGGSRVSFGRMLFNNWFTLTIMGLWHGANWTYVMFGFIHGFFIVMSRIWDRYFPKLTLPQLLPGMKAFTGVFLAFWIFNLTCIPDIFFRSNTVGDAWGIIQNIFSPDTTSYLIHNSAAKGAVPSVIEFWVSIACVALLLFTDYKLYTNKSVGIDKFVVAKPFYARWSFYVVFLVIVTLFAYTSKSVFIYFAF
jgi:alginate O-acetyltransferase complex protein AlgI